MRRNWLAPNLKLPTIISLGGFLAKCTSSPLMQERYEMAPGSGSQLFTIMISTVADV